MKIGNLTAKLLSFLYQQAKRDLTLDNTKHTGRQLQQDVVLLTKAKISAAIMK